MTCKDCINFKWCKSQSSEKISYYDGLSCMENKCHGFKNKSQYIKLPCKIGDIVWDKNAKPFIIHEIKIFSKIINIKGKSLVTGDNKSFSLGQHSIGKTIFFNLDEAIEFRDTNSIRNYKLCDIVNYYVGEERIKYIRKRSMFNDDEGNKCKEWLKINSL